MKFRIARKQGEENEEEPYRKVKLIPGLKRTMARIAPSSIRSITSSLILQVSSLMMLSNNCKQLRFSASRLSIGLSGQSINVSRVERNATSATISSFHPEYYVIS